MDAVEALLRWFEALPFHMQMLIVGALALFGACPPLLVLIPYAIYKKLRELF